MRTIEKYLSNKDLARFRGQPFPWDPDSGRRVEREIKRRARKHQRHAGHEAHARKD